MKKLSCEALIIFFFLLPLPILSMDFSSDQYTPVAFKTDDGIVQIPKKNIPLIGALCERLDYYKQLRVKPKVIPLLPGTSAKGLTLVNRALNCRPDTFADSFNKLPKEDQALLVQSSGLFKLGENNRIVMGLCVPEITKRLFDAYGMQEIYTTHVNPLLDEPDEVYVNNYCKRQLIQSKGFFTKQPILPIFGAPSPLESKIDLQSLFINGTCAHKELSPIPLYTNGKLCNVYAYNFVSEYGEYRLTKLAGNSCEYLLWFIDHKNTSSTLAALIKHNGPLKGCCFSKTKTDTEYVITYSETDINFSTITRHADGSIEVTCVHAYTKNNDIIAAVGYDHHLNSVHVGIYQGTNNVITSWQANGTQIQTVSSGFWSFKKYGVLDQIVATKSDYYNPKIFYIFTVADMYDIHKFEWANNTWTTSHRTGFNSLTSHNLNFADFHGRIIRKNDDTVIYYNYWASPFESIENAAKKKQQSTLWQSLKDDIYFEPTEECHKRYSPLGNLLLRHSLKKKAGLLYVETQIQDAQTHKPIMAIDTLYSNFAGVGFSHDEQELIFINHNGLNETVSLGLSDTNKKELETFASIALGNCGTAALLKRLSIEYEKQGCILLDQDDPVRTMLIEFAKHPGMLKFFETCFPFRKVQTNQTNLHVDQG